MISAILSTGYTKECPIEMGLRGIMSYCVGAEGTTNIQRTVIAREMLGKEFIARARPRMILTN